MSKITELSQLDLNQTYSYADYLTWQFDDALELIKGKIMLMSPAPNVLHQRISMSFSGTLFSYFHHKKCQVFAAPFDVRLYDRKKSILANKDIQTVVQPDLCVICRPELLDQQGCNGAPDWIIEILSPGNSKREMKIKYNLYQEAGVTEYWLVDPVHKAIHQLVLDDSGCYQIMKMVTDEDSIFPQLFPDLIIEVAEVFETWQAQQD
ncbi:Uma2 family endonuclease [Crenothrix sp.]|uniref:Uma2 family endonuclease n=1 Tax=Crenothrix sp. TaxID=3100433 RepID=UPI00374D3793